MGAVRAGWAKLRDRWESDLDCIEVMSVLFPDTGGMFIHVLSSSLYSGCVWQVWPPTWLLLVCQGWAVSRHHMNDGNRTMYRVILSRRVVVMQVSKKEPAGMNQGCFFC